MFGVYLIRRTAPKSKSRAHGLTAVTPQFLCVSGIFFQKQAPLEGFLPRAQLTCFPGLITSLT